MAVRNCEELGPCLRKITNRLLANQNLCKLLSIRTKDPLGAADIADTSTLFSKNIKIIPKLDPVETDESIMIIAVSTGMIDVMNSEYRNIVLTIGIYVPLNQWAIKDENLRPFAIIGEIQKSLDKKDVNGLGRLQVGNFELSMISGDVSRYDLEVRVTNFD